ncbi:MAG: hypothetical protein Q8R12_00765 [bacterium]|nr:hypothetical protein [bacterium]
MDNSQPNQQLNKRERYELKHRQKLTEQAGAARKKILKKISKIALILLLAGGIMGWLIWYVANQSETPESEIISRNGLHWHPELAIYVKGLKQEIPANIGIGAVHQPMHTHDATGVLHFEFQGLVRQHDITLGQFFKNWGKDMRSFGTNVKMTVNGEENAEFENYVMQDKDRVELRFE